VEHGALEWKISRASFVTTCTNQGLRYLKVHLPVTYHKKLYLNYHGIELVSGFPVPGGKGNGHSKRSDMVIAVGRLVRKKGFADLLRAFSLVVRERPHSRLMIVGDGPGRQELTALTEQLDLKERVEFMGWQPPDVTLALISHAAVLAVPSAIADDGDRDGIPNVILEAFASGTPVIASRLEGISEAIEHRRTGLGVKPGDIAELAAAIKELLNDKHLQRQLSQKACETAVQRFDSAKNARQLAELFMSVN
jgi:glycosyltransferase involved in cell wall biosynthesis